MIIQCWLEAGGSADSLRYVAFHHIINDDVVDAINREMDRQRATPDQMVTITPADAAWNENLFARCSSSVARALSVLDPARPTFSPKAHIISPDPDRDWMHMIVDLNRNGEDSPPVAANETTMDLGNSRPARSLGSGLLGLSLRLSNPSGNSAGDRVASSVVNPTSTVGSNRTTSRRSRSVRSSLQKVTKSTTQNYVSRHLKCGIQLSGKFVDAVSNLDFSFHFQVSK